MKGTLYIPYANSSAEKGFVNKKPLSTSEYVKTEVKEYVDHEKKVDYMMQTRYGMNMAKNNYEKRHFNYKKQDYEYFECPCVLLNSKGKEEIAENFNKYLKTGEQFILILNLNEKCVRSDADIETELRKWISESGKVLKCNKLTDVEKMKHLPRKDFKVKIDENDYVLKDCKFAKMMSNSYLNSFAVIVSKLRTV